MRPVQGWLINSISRMIIDAHQHFWQYNPVRDTWMPDAVIRRDFLPEHLAPVLAVNGVEGCVAVQAGQSEDETHFLLELAEKHYFIKGVVGWVDLRAPDLEERLQYFAQFPKLKGFRHIVQGEADDRFLLREDFCRGIALLGKYNFTYDILVFPHQLPAVLEFVAQFPNQRFVIDHLAKPDYKKEPDHNWAQHMRAIGRHHNVYCKLSGMVTEADWKNWEQENFDPMLEVVLTAFGSSRTMFGSDWPVCLLAAEYAEVKEILEHYISGFSHSEAGMIMGGNARTFYKL